MKILVAFILLLVSPFGVKKTEAQVAIGVSVGIAPPELPVYTQPPCPTDGYLWSPGYWAYGSDGYYWVPGVWVSPPQVGFLWTPGYWGFVDGGYYWNGGYWGENVGFYGGVCYGYGYGGTGFYGGRWQGGRFQYNTAAWHVGGGFRNTYVDRAGMVNNANRSSFNGRGGIDARPNAAEQSAARESHVRATSAQQSHQQKASTSRNQLASVNHGSPATTARSKVGGDRFNSSGHSISTIHSANSGHTTAGNHISNPVASHPVNNAAHANPSPQQHSSMQNRPAPQQHMAQPGNMQRSAPQGGGSRGGQVGGGRMGGDGGHGRH